MRQPKKGQRPLTNRPEVSRQEEEWFAVQKIKSQTRHGTKLEAGGKFQRSFQALSLSLSLSSLVEGQQSAMGCNLFHLSLCLSLSLVVSLCVR